MRQAKNAGEVDMPKIETGIPCPRKPRNKYPFSDMKVGDSFFWSNGDGSTIRSAASVSSQRLKYKFSVVKENGGFRVFRIQ